MCQGKQNEQVEQNKQYEQVCKGEFASIHAKLDKLDEAIRGNGKPGIQLRLDRLETSQATRSRLLWLVAGAAATLAVGAIWKFAAGGF
jgi:hypothetical protein